MTADRRFPLHWPDGWPRTPPGLRKAATFKVTAAKARDEMLRELQLLGAKHVIISSNNPRNRDGSLSVARRWIDDVGVAVYFQRKGVDVVIACDQYTEFHANMRAIGKTVEALRGIERWGASDLLDRAFTGFVALPAPECARPWREVLGLTGPVTTADIKAAYRERAKTEHPDTPGGSMERMAVLTRARDEALAAVQ